MEGIRLELKDYCERCIHFEVAVDMIEVTRGNGEQLADITIKCKKADICERMYRRLAKK